MVDAVLYSTEPLEKGGSLGFITLNRPQVRNAIDLSVVNELGAALDRAAADEQVRVLIVSGAGDKAFASGADIAQLKERNVADALRRINSSIFRRLEEHPLPVIAAVKGWCLGGGCELAMACDLRIAGKSAKFGQPEVSLGILPGAGAVQRLPKLVGLGRAKELIYTGRIIDAEEAERIGLVNRVVPDEDVMKEARALAVNIASQGSLAVRISKLALNASARSNPAFDTLDALGQAVLFETPEKHERMQAFLEKRSKKSSD
jgi:enoyl-CoA hydratase